MTLSRRTVLGVGAVALVLAATPVSGCALLQNDPVPLVPFTDFVVRESGGVDGRNLPLVVLADGRALMIGRDEVAAGQLSADKMARLKTLLESEDLRREAANPPRESKRQCSDTVGITIEMGALLIGRGHTCDEGVKPTPTYDEILGLLAEARDGTFDAPLSDMTPALPMIRLDRTGGEDDLAVTVTIQSDGASQIASHGGGEGIPRHEMLATEQRDALRLMLAKNLSEHIRLAPCEDLAGTYTFRVGDKDPIEVTCSEQPALEIAIRTIEQGLDLD